MNQAMQTKSGDASAENRKFQVMLNGVLPNVAPAEAKAKLATLFKASPEQVDNILANPGFIVKKGCTPDVAAKYKVAIERAGGACALIPEDVPDESLDIDLPKSPATVGPPKRVEVSDQKKAAPSLGGGIPSAPPEPSHQSFCTRCSAPIDGSAAFCGSCGTRVAGAAATSTSKSAASSRDSAEQVSETWKRRFALLEKAGGPKLSKARELNFKERLVLFNAWGFIFGPFYYLAKGMWKKAIVLFVLCVAAIVVLTLMLDAIGVSAAITNFIAPVVFATRANIDYFKKVVLGDNGWW